MTDSKRVFLGCWVSLDEQDRLCEVALDKSATEEVSGLSEQQIDSIFQAFRRHRVEVRREGDASSNPIIILDDVPSVIITPDVNTPPQTPPERLEKRPRPGSYVGMAARSSSRAKKGSSQRQGRRSRHSSQEIDSLRLSGDLNHNAPPVQTEFPRPPSLSHPKSIPHN